VILKNWKQPEEVHLVMPPGGLLASWRVWRHCRLDGAARACSQSQIARSILKSPDLV
jgi:hypothetical protein